MPPQELRSAANREKEMAWDWEKLQEEQKKRGGGPVPPQMDDIVKKIRKFKLIGEAFTVDNGMMTPTLKLKRKVITERYDALIQNMYADVL